MNSRTHWAVTIALVGAIYLATTAASWALGFRNPDQNAVATGQGEAFVAQADDASAIYYNPAGLTQLQGTEISAGGYLWLPEYDFKGAAGKDNMTLTSAQPHLYAATDFGLKKWRFGLGANIPFGNVSEWGKTGPFVNITTKSSLAVLGASATVAYQINEHLSLGAGLNFYLGNTQLENLSLAPGGGNFRFKGHGEAFGATAGVLWKINEHHSLGAVYRSPFTITFSDSAVLH